MALVERRFRAIQAENGKPSFSVFQFNALADELSDAFPLVDKRWLSWENRKERLLLEILRFSPDLICLEEIDHFEDFFLPRLSEKGYQGFFKKKKSGKDGLAIFYSPRFDLVKSDIFFFEELMGKSSNQVGAICAFQLKNPEEPGGKGEGGSSQPGVVLAGTHLKASHGFSKYRKNQTKVLLERIRLFNSEFNWPCVVAGDFNLEADEPSYPLALKAGYQSAYAENGKEPPYTTYKIRESENFRTIDYLFYSGQLEPFSLLSIPEKEEFGPIGLPSELYPSDHVAIMAFFQFKL